jgi:hypothetical protein
MGRYAKMANHRVVGRARVKSWVSFLVQGFFLAFFITVTMLYDSIMAQRGNHNFVIVSMTIVIIFPVFRERLVGIAALMV